MLRIRALAVLLILSFAFASREARASREERCTNTICSAYCIVYGEFAGNCNYTPTEPTSGCIMLYGPDCASTNNAYCCTISGGGF